MKKAVVAALVALSVSLTIQRGSSAQQTDVQVSSGAVSVRATTVAELRAWDTFVTAGDRSGGLRVHAAQRDPDFPARVIERYDQFHNGVRIWGADIVRGSERGVPYSVFGELASPDLQLSTDPALSLDEARTALLRLGGPDARLLVEPELVIIRLDSGDYRLAYTAVVSGNGDVVRAFSDAQTGVELLRYTEIQRQQASVGTAQGIYGDRKKVSVESSTAGFVAVDRLRPPTFRTFDLGGGVDGMTRMEELWAGAVPGASELARDADNVWTDPAVTEAHAHTGMAYDYFYKRFGRSGLDGRNSPINIMVNALTQEDALAVPSDLLDEYWNWFANASWCGRCFDGQGLMWFGNGYPGTEELVKANRGTHVTHVAAALDVVVHELTHGVTTFTSGLIYRNESGALNEAFSDIMGISAEFFYYPRGSGIREADYVLGVDAWRGVWPGVLDGIRSMENPELYRQPDHYSNLYLGEADNGGVHINSGIPNQAFYLAIEGGRNRTSGLAVQGVGAANREQIEKVFFRAFTLHMPRGANFRMARAVTTLAAQELYGVGGAVERAVTEAWTAVGVLDDQGVTLMSPWDGTVGPVPTGGNEWQTTISTVVTMPADGYYLASLNWDTHPDHAAKPDWLTLILANIETLHIYTDSAALAWGDVVCRQVRAGEQYRLSVQNYGDDPFAPIPSTRDSPVSFAVRHWIANDWKTLYESWPAWFFTPYSGCPPSSEGASGVNQDVGDAMRRLVSEDAR
jgi:Zn-dependent metalloprotease